MNESPFSVHQGYNKMEIEIKENRTFLCKLIVFEEKKVAERTGLEPARDHSR